MFDIDGEEFKGYGLFFKDVVLLLFFIGLYVFVLFFLKLILWLNFIFGDFELLLNDYWK